ncbi:Zn(II)2Cys6 transcription factor domain-containing protein [Aspergillus clavatus NRRL 1]|uniref:C6 finger domain protein, putative n=1 Tax=Aspergillus clavatus (strain ATCC 1007 / CBS 513.65 / DSM 816 / NCTC 3887 / NRRL 1 / QM 1276 / 107) TaxID=344612 RepID=A1CLP9_ASPCL|nr:C6 finger domain protein, putative [Aspergillus clavatus NRRL 1]EAW09028.1 C6 finger domain protein, putative [Aspergillus clavatus NRRL 1]
MRRKACNACVQAKTKCCYTQPTCSRCAKRGLACEYVSTTNPANPMPSAASASSSSLSANEPPRPDENRMDTTDSPSLWNRRSPLGSSGADSLDSWGSQNFFWNLDTIDLPSLPSSSTSVVNEVTLGPTPAIQTSHPSLTFPLTTPPSQPSYSMLLDEPAMAPPGPGVPDLSTLTGLATRETNGSPQALLSIPDAPRARASNNMHLLLQYRKLLLQEDFYCPFLHRTLFNEHVPDMTILPQTSMAICCGSALDVKDAAGYVKRAMDAQRQSLIESYPTYHCMEQWDALHAMLLYEIIEMGVAPVDESETWKRKRRTKGLKSPFLSKMTQCFSRSYLESHDAALLPITDGSGSWVKWAVTETARRTIFLANIVNFLSNRDLESGRQSPYYEPLNDELIMNMPLPCNQALWSARTEDEWRKATQTAKPTSPTISAGAADPFAAFGTASVVAGNSSAAPHIPVGEQLLNHHVQPSLKLLFSKFAKDYLRANFAKSAGFAESDELRSFIILCALEQFP